MRMWDVVCSIKVMTETQNKFFGYNSVIHNFLLLNLRADVNR